LEGGKGRQNGARESRRQSGGYEYKSVRDSEEKNSEEGGGQGEVGEILGTNKMRESLMDMRFKGVGGEGKRGPKRIKLVCWGVVGEGSEVEVNAGQGDV
jgi:hypothetical protein